MFIKRVTASLLSVLFLFASFSQVFANALQNELIEPIEKQVAALKSEGINATDSSRCGLSYTKLANLAQEINALDLSASTHIAQFGRAPKFRAFVSPEKSTAGINFDNHEISWKYYGARENQASGCDGLNELTGGKTIASGQKLVLEEILPNVNVKYKSCNFGLKEDLILKNRQSQSVFIVKYNIGDLFALQNGENEILLVDEIKKECIAISAPYMEDSAGAKSEAVSLRILEQTGSELTVEISTDEAWLSAKSREYPVVLDPIYGPKDVKDKKINFGPGGSSFVRTEFYAKNTGDSVYLHLQDTFSGVVKLRLIGRGGPNSEGSCCCRTPYYLLEPGKYYELFNQINESGYREICLEFERSAGQVIIGEWSPDFSPDSRCIRLGGQGKGNTGDEHFDLTVGANGRCETQIRPKANSSSSYVNLTGSHFSGTAEMQIMGIGGDHGDQVCNNAGLDYYEVSSGKKYEILNSVFEDLHPGARLVFKAAPGTRICGIWSPDSTPEAGCTVLGRSSAAEPGIQIKAITNPTKMIKVPFISQVGRFPTGCESVSAVMWLNYYGHSVSADEFITALPKAPSPSCGGRGADPYSYFIGDPRSTSGYGCFAPVIEATASKFLSSGERVQNTTGKSLEFLIHEYIDRGHPVVFWATMGMKSTRYGSSSWYLNESGKRFNWPGNEHCLVLVGYNDTEYFVNDPLKSEPGAYPKDVVEKRYKEQGSQSLIISGGTPGFSHILPKIANPQPGGKVLSLGAAGEDVREIQKKLQQYGYFLGSCGADGKFGPETMQAVKKFQKDSSVAEDGIVGPQTLSALQKRASLDSGASVKPHSFEPHDTPNPLSCFHSATNSAFDFFMNPFNEVTLRALAGRNIHDLQNDDLIDLIELVSSGIMGTLGGAISAITPKCLQQMLSNRIVDGTLKTIGGITEITIAVLLTVGSGGSLTAGGVACGTFGVNNLIEGLSQLVYCAQGKDEAGVNPMKALAGGRLNSTIDLANIVTDVRAGAQLKRIKPAAAITDAAELVIWDMPEGGKMINGRWYTMHALERMAPDTFQVRAELLKRAADRAARKGLAFGSDKWVEEVHDYVKPRNIPPMVVEDAIINGKRVPGRDGVFECITPDLKVIINEAGSVITIFAK